MLQLLMDACSSFTVFYRVSQDAGMWMLMFDMEARQAYLENFLIKIGVL